MTLRIEPGRTLGVLGGGQLGAMFTIAAKRLGYRVAVWDPDPDAPAHSMADHALSRPFDDRAALAEFRLRLSAVTFEWENVPVALIEALEATIPVRPPGRILRIIQHRVRQKSFLAEHGLAVPPFRHVECVADLRQAADAIGYPCLCKTSTFGYDGKGQWRLPTAADAVALQHAFERTPPQVPDWIVEPLVSFDKELSVLVVRSAAGDCRLYPVVENVHRGGILRTTRVPAEIDRDLVQEARRMAAAAVHALDGVGVFCVELFLLSDRRLLINEIAPRPHNSGHYTLDACSISQFEQQVRALCGLPLGEVRLLCPAMMVNLIGEDFVRATSDRVLVDLLSTPGAKLHIYGKREIRAGRKMAHVTFLGEKSDQAGEAATRFVEQLERPSDH